MPTEIGVMLNNLEPDRLRAFEVASRFGFHLVHTNAIDESWLDGDKRRQYVEAAQSSGLTIATMFVGFAGQDYSSVASVQQTVGLAVPDLRKHRLDVAGKYIDIAKELNCPSLTTHLGYPPTDPEDHADFIQTIRQLADACSKRGLRLHFETGQESASDLLRLMQEIDRGNLGVNFDPGNFVIYGTDDPVVALEALGSHIKGFHCKDGRRPTRAGELGTEPPLGSGEVDFPEILRRLKMLPYRGPLVIEREQSVDRQAEIVAARDYLLSLLGET